MSNTNYFIKAAILLSKRGSRPANEDAAVEVGDATAVAVGCDDDDGCCNDDPFARLIFSIDLTKFPSVSALACDSFASSLM